MGHVSVKAKGTLEIKSSLWIPLEFSTVEFIASRWLTDIYYLCTPTLT